MEKCPANLGEWGRADILGRWIGIGGSELSENVNIIFSRM
jgi:hypothetical protein